MGDVAAALAAAGQEIALDVPAGATVGGVVAYALAGPRRLRYGSPRDLLIGITVVRADGTVARSGGKVVKNVAGYDLGKLFCRVGGDARADHRGDVPAAPAARGAGVRDRGVRRFRYAGRLRRRRRGRELTAGRVGRGTAPAVRRAGRCVSVLLEGSADGVAARAAAMADLLGARGPPGPRCRSRAAVVARAAGAAPARPWCGCRSGCRRSAWCSTRSTRRPARRGSRHRSPGSAGAGVLYISCPPGEPAACAGFPGRCAARSITRAAVSPCWRRPPRCAPPSPTAAGWPGASRR